MNPVRRLLISEMNDAHIGRASDFVCYKRSMAKVEISLEAN